MNAPFPSQFLLGTPSEVSCKLRVVAPDQETALSIMKLLSSILLLSMISATTAKENYMAVCFGTVPDSAKKAEICGGLGANQEPTKCSKFCENWPDNTICLQQFCGILMYDACDGETGVKTQALQFYQGYADKFYQGYVAKNVDKNEKDECSTMMAGLSCTCIDENTMD